MESRLTAIFASVGQLVRNNRQREALQLLEEVDETGLEPSDLSQFYILRTTANLYLGDYDDKDIKRAISVSRSLESPARFIKANLIEGLLHWKQGHWTESRRIFSKVCNMAEKAGDKENKAIVLNLMAMDSVHSGDSETATSRFHESIRLFEEIGDRQRKRDVAHNLANWCLRYGRIQEALSEYLANPLSSDEVQSRTATNYLQNISEAYSLLGRTDEARDALSKCMPYIADDRRDHATYYQHMGRTYWADGDFETACDCFQNCLEISEETGCDVRVGVRRWLAECYLELGDLKRSERYTLEALSLAEANDEQFEIGACGRALAEIACLKGDEARARQLYRNAIHLFKTLSFGYELAKTRYWAGHSGLFPFAEQEELVALSEKYFEFESIPVPDRVTNAMIRLARAILDADPDTQKHLGSDDSLASDL